MIMTQLLKFSPCDISTKKITETIFTNLFFGNPFYRKIKIIIYSLIMVYEIIRCTVNWTGIDNESYPLAREDVPLIRASKIFLTSSSLKCSLISSANDFL